MHRARRTEDRFDRVNLGEAELVEQVAHGGVGRIRFARLVDGADAEGACNFVDLAVLAPGVSIGEHRHGADEEEYYLVLDGRGTMRRGDEQFEVAAGDLVRNPPGGSHGLTNTGEDDLRIFVFEVAVTEGSDR